MKEYVVNKYHNLPYDIYIGRGSIWGNRFSHLESLQEDVYKVDTREDAVINHEEWFFTQPELMRRIHELKGKKLGCYCAPLPCHGDFLSDLANSEVAVSFTGHRPDRLAQPCWTVTHPHAGYIGDKLKPILINLITKRKAVKFISGGALGFDQIAFWTVQKLKKDYPHIKNVVYVPYSGQADLWGNPIAKEWYFKMLALADEVIYTDTLEKYQIRGVEVGKYHVAKLQKRNVHMVDDSEIVIACFNGETGQKSGTYNCVKYILNQEKEMIQINPNKDYQIEGDKNHVKEIN